MTLWEDVTAGRTVLRMARDRRERVSYVVIALEFPGIDQPMLVVSFPGGGHLSIEFTDDAPDDEQPRLGAWLELRADDQAAVLPAALEAGLTEVKHPGHRCRFRRAGSGMGDRPDAAMSLCADGADELAGGFMIH